nr:hypothetical protein [uncultured Prevotella sp.]
MAITSFYLLNIFPRMHTSSLSPNNQHPTPKQNMFPRMRTLSSSPNNQYPTPKPNMFPRMRTLHHHPTIITQHPSQTCSLECALYIITQQSTPITQAKHVPSDAHFIIITEQSTPITQAKHVPLDAHFTSSPNSQHPSPNSHERDSIDFSIKLAC